MNGPAINANVACGLTFETVPGTSLALQVAVAPSAGTVLSEQLDLTLNGRPLAPAAEFLGAGGGRVHMVDADAGTLRVSYQATVAPTVPALLAPPARGAEIVVDAATLLALHQSAYCRSDLLAGFAAAELGRYRGEPDLPERVASWVFERVAYELGSSGPLDSSVETLLTNTGVCRDFAHLTITLLRALGVPARLVAVYAPGLSPMDFHAVVEAYIPAGWHVIDATRLAPRGSLVRITTGRDAADTAFTTTLRGNAELLVQSVFAATDGSLPADDHVTAASLA